VTLSFALDRALWGLTSFGYHVTNTILHIAVVGLFYGWCTRVLDSSPVAASAPRGKEDPPAADWAAFFAAGIFAVHPVMSSAVGYVAARSELLAAAGVLASLTYARRAIVGKKRGAAILSACFGVLAVGSSSSAAALPLLVLAYDAWVLRDPRWPLRAARVYAPATFAIVSAAAWQVTTSGIAAVPPRGPIGNLLTESRVVWRYLGLLAMPRGQALVHDVHYSSAFDPLSLVALAALIGGIVFAIRLRRAAPLFAFGVVWFFGVLAPTTSFIPVRDAMAEPRLYLASAGALLALAALTWRAIASRRAVRIALSAAMLALAIVTYRRNALSANPVELWEESIRRAPNAWQAHWGYGELLREISRCDRARPEYEAVLRLNPQPAGARAGLDACAQP
jgi:hypothetical protein